MQQRFTRKTVSQLADIDTPISIYLKLRDHYDRVLLLESNDFQSAENSHSYICFDALCTLRVHGERLELTDLAGTRSKQVPAREVIGEIKKFAGQFVCTGAPGPELPASGFFGYFSYNAVRYCEDIEVATCSDQAIADIALDFFRFVIIFDHYHQSVHIVEHLVEGEESQVPEVQNLIQRADILRTPFAVHGDLQTNISDVQYRQNVADGIAHCQRGDVFQVVLSRRFEQAFKGDNFNVYRALRRINPSPYLFYFDYGTYQLFGSSPEAQLVIHGGTAQINPIAGTYPRTGDPTRDKEASALLLQDQKELSEHTMLVDLARNDLNRHAHNVHVSAYRQIHKYSHVMHMVSEVCGTLEQDTHVLEVFADCFPAGTLSGAPKYRAMEIIRDLETTARGFYGGAIGFFDFNQNMNTAIMIRSFLSHRNKLYFQAGAGIVASSDPEKESAEVLHKVQALTHALKMATNRNMYEIASA